MSRLFNFSAGPSALPLPVLEQAAAERVDFRGAGMSLLEMSHRGAHYDAVHAECLADLRALLNASDDYAVLFMGGGARTQFALVPTNLRPAGTAAYLTTGHWSRGAISEAAKLGPVKALWSSEGSGFDRVPAPSDFVVPPDAAYLHYTSNNTIYGTQYHYVPDPGETELVCDMSSDILCRPVDVSRYGLIYAGAQKNLGPAGVTVLVIRRDLLERSRADLPEMWSYRAIDKKNSMLNTPPVYAIYLVGLVAKHLLARGGAEAVADVNERKAARLYAAIDGTDFWTGHAQPGSRSIMNVTFRSPSATLDARFVAEAAEAGLIGLKGHKSVGGLRASIYNAVPDEAAVALVDFMADFVRRLG